MKPDPRTRKMLMTIRAALIMAAKAIEEYCRDEVVNVETKAENITITTS